MFRTERGHEIAKTGEILSTIVLLNYGSTLAFVSQPAQKYADDILAVKKVTLLLTTVEVGELKRDKRL